MAETPNLSSIDPATLAALQAIMAQQQPKKSSTPLIIGLCSALAIAVVCFVIVLKYPSTTPDKEPSDDDTEIVDSNFQADIDKIFAGKAVSEKAFFGHAAATLADLYEADSKSSKPSFVSVGQVRGPLVAETGRWVSNAGINQKLSKTNKSKLQKLWVSVFTDPIPEKAADRDAVTADEAAAIVHNLRDVAAACGVK